MDNTLAVILTGGAAIGYGRGSHTGGNIEITGIAQVINAPLENLSVNLPLGSAITCDTYHSYEKVGSADILIVNNSGEGVYDDDFLTSVNDYSWTQ